VEKFADFYAVRSLHAQEASRLVERQWKDPATGEPLFLIEDTHLRKHFGELIGKLAASHNWSIEMVKIELPHQANSPAELPGEWSVEPRKLACLLRCADALHIDNRRAPDFFHALLQRSGVSFDHWRAQNQIGHVALDRSDPTGRTVLLTTTRPFLEADAASWWVIFDAATVAQRELETSNALLTAEGTQPFQVRRIRGVESPELMSEFVRASGWTPCAAQIHISNVEQLVGSLGGKQLYGQDSDPLAIAIRELVQNARDAIKARAHMDPGFEGEIRVRVLRSEPTIVEVEDNGIGMSRRVLTGPLLDFGTSFWASSLVRSEFPGLSSSGFVPVGKFGIGFYSVFMASNNVTVSTKRWDDGLKDTHTLAFTGGLTLRPLLKAGQSRQVGVATSTVVALTLKPALVNPERSVTIKPGVMGVPDLVVPLADYFAVLVAGLDVDVTIDVEGFGRVRHRRQPLPQAERMEWLSRIAFVMHRENAARDLLFVATGDRLRPIFDGDRCIGLAAISAHPRNQTMFTSVSTVGGLATNAHAARDNFYVGFIDHPPASAKRDPAEHTAHIAALKPWAEEQKALLLTAHLDPIQRCVAAYGLAEFGVDPTELACLQIWTAPARLEFLTFAQLIERIRSTPLLFCKSSFLDHIDAYAQISGIDGLMVYRPISNGQYNSLKLDGGAPAEKCSLLGGIHAAMNKAGLVPVLETLENIGQSMFGPVHGLILRSVSRDRP
jgi:hypothetical protein